MNLIEEIVSIVREAGKIITGTHSALNVEAKPGSANFVTEYDLAVQNFLYEKLGALLPEAVFIGEESEENRPELLKDHLCFIIDPIDGTTNFIHDWHHSAISVGLSKNGQMELGVVYNPYLNEMFTAVRGEGAFCNGKPIHRENVHLADGIAAFGTSPYYADKADATFLLVRKIFDAARDIHRCGSAALDICYTACGRACFYVEAILSPWDYAAGSLILTEAGGVITTFDGTPITLDRPCSVVCGSPVSHAEGMALIRETLR